jgi:hypothetical protein
MGDIEHAGTPKTMAAITDDKAATAGDKPTIRTSDDGAEVVGEIAGEPTSKTPSPPGADTVAAERGMPPIRKPTALGMPAFRTR